MRKSSIAYSKDKRIYVSGYDSIDSNLNKSWLRRNISRGEDALRREINSHAAQPKTKSFVERFKEYFNKTSKGASLNNYFEYRGDPTLGRQFAEEVKGELFNAAGAAIGGYLGSRNPRVQNIEYEEFHQPEPEISINDPEMFMDYYDSFNNPYVEGHQPFELDESENMFANY